MVDKYFTGIVCRQSLSAESRGRHSRGIAIYLLTYWAQAFAGLRGEARGGVGPRVHDPFLGGRIRVRKREYRPPIL